LNPVRAIREAARLSQQQLAEAAATSQATSAAYGGERKSPTWRTVVRPADAANVVLAVQYVPPLTREDRRSLALHGAIAERLRQDPEPVLARARASLLRMQTLHPGARPLLDEWRMFLQRPLEALVPVLLDPSPWGRDLRQVTPFAGVLSARERAEGYRRFARDKRTTTDGGAMSGQRASWHANSSSTRSVPPARCSA
jgi:transcriptional regulator with XRE-family HTH domain